MSKKLASLLLIVSVCFSVFSVSAAAISPPIDTTSNASIPTSGVQSTDPTHATGIYNTSNNKELSTMATGLLAGVSLELYLINGNTLVLEGSTVGTEVLSKIGFEDITLQRWQNGQWTNVKVWSTYKSNSATYDYEYTTTVSGGYNYRCVATHYGENDWLIFSSVQTIYNETSYLYVS